MNLYDSDEKPDEQLHFDLYCNNDTFATTLGKIDLQNAQEITTGLYNEAFLHSYTPISKPTEQSAASPGTFSAIAVRSTRYGSDIFYGIVLPTGASKTSTVGRIQCLAYKSSTLILPSYSASKT